MHKTLKLLPLVALLLQACGGGKSTDEAEIIAAPTIMGSSFSGLAFSAVNRDRNIRTSRIYFYDFVAGKINEALSGESGSPAVFFKDAKLFVVNRDSGNQNVKVVDDIKTTPVVPATVDLEGFTAGDPWSLETVTGGKTVLLGAPESGKLFMLDYQAGETTEVDVSKLKNKPIRAVGLQRIGSTINVVHNGVKKIAADSYTADGTQALYRLKIDADGAVSFTDEDPTSTEIEGTPLAPTNPVPAGVSGNTITLVGLCNSVISGCNQAIENYTSGSITMVNDFAAAPAFKFQLVNQIIPGPSADQVFAHVLTEASEYKLILMDIKTLAVTEVHTFSDYNLYGFNYDTGSKTLFVGESGDQSGTLYIYKDLTLSDKVDISGVLFSSAFIP